MDAAVKFAGELDVVLKKANRTRCHSLENPSYLQKTLSLWRSLPLSMVVMEYSGDGDPGFGGNADDRVLGQDGLILDRNARNSGHEPVQFKTIQDAHAAARMIVNRRPDTILGVVPTWR